ncbi:MAG: hypothetical protein H9W81_01760, partial [Enterococcus sp.]|nr:hypothetical protein [Enterococcus sp.]
MDKIEEYISKRKRKDKLNEFDFTQHSENMGKVIQYVSDYFNNYLSPEDYSYEQIKLQQNIEKSRKTLENRYPQTHDFIEKYYLEHQKRIDTFIGKACESFKDIDILYREDDFRKVAEEVVFNRLCIEDMNEDDFDNVTLAVEEYLKNHREKPYRSEMKNLDSKIVNWVFDSYRKYGVNISAYAYNIAWKWEDKYVERKYVREYEESCRINNYDYRYQENPFEIDQEFEKYKELPFFENKRDYLEMLVMYFWLFDMLEDTSYWAEYVQLCITQRNVDLKLQKGMLIPVIADRVNYPEEIEANIEYIETKKGTVKGKKSEKYILSVVNEKGNDNIWVSKETRNKILTNLSKSFEEFGRPEILELRTPIKTPNFGIKELLDAYREIEKKLKPLKKMRVALKTSSVKSGKEPVVHTIKDILALYRATKDLKLGLKIILDLVDNRNGSNVLKKNCFELAEILGTNRDLFIGFHINGIDSWRSWGSLYNQSKG